MVSATTDRPSTLAPQAEPATLIPLATSVSHGVRITASWRSTHVPARSSARSHEVRCATTNATARPAARTSHAVAVIATGRGGGGGSPVGRR